MIGTLGYLSTLSTNLAGLGSRLSAALASILYQTSLGDFVYNTDSSGNAILDNQGSAGSTYDGLLNTGRALQLGATNDLAIPIHNTGGTGSFLTYYDFTKSKFITLGNSVDGGSSEELVDFDTQSSFDSSGWINIDNENKTVSWDGGLAVANDIGLIAVELSSIYTGRWIRISYTITNYTGTGNCGIDQNGVLIDSPLGTTVDTRVDANGSYSFLCYLDGTATHLGILGRTTNGFTISNISYSEVLPISTTYTFTNQTVNNILTHSTAWSALDFVKINNNPQLMAKLADPSGSGTILELDLVLVAGDEYYPCSENEGAYVVDAKAGYGSELFTNGDFSSATGWVLGAGASITGGELVFNAIGQTAVVYQDVLSLDSYYIIEFDVTAYTSGALQCGAGAALDDVKIAEGINATGHYSYIFKSGTSPSVGLRADVSDFIGSVDNASVRAATATEITNYASTIRTNVDFNPKGLQTTCLVLDGAGVPTAYDATALHFYSNGYVDTQWNPTVKTPWTLTETINTVENVVLDTDNVNENANYLLGKGAYPKVTADPYATYTQESFKVED